jgi:hypothetical protein
MCAKHKYEAIWVTNKTRNRFFIAIRFSSFAFNLHFVRSVAIETTKNGFISILASFGASKKQFIESASCAIPADHVSAMNVSVE